MNWVKHHERAGSQVVIERRRWGLSLPVCVTTVLFLNAGETGETIPPPERFDNKLDASAGLTVRVVGGNIIVVALTLLLNVVELPLPVTEADGLVPSEVRLDDVSPR
jgi:hypothetical protein